MHRRSVSLIASAAMLVVLAAPAHAADYPGSWKKGFPPASDIGASLGTYTTAPSVDIAKFSGKWFVCRDLKAKPQDYIASAQYSPTPLTQSLVEAQSRVYSSPAKAKSAFAGIRADLGKCDGSAVEETEPGSGVKWRETTTTGEVADLESDGQPTLFIYTRATPAKGSSAKQSGLVSKYILMTLSGDTILITTADIAGKSKVTATQQGDTVSFARDFLGTWDKANS